MILHPSLDSLDLLCIILRAIFLTYLLYKTNYVTWVYFVPVFFFLSLCASIIKWLRYI